MNLSLTDVLALVKGLKAIYDPIAGTKLSTNQTIAVILQVLDLLQQHNVTIADLETILKEFGPFLALVVKA